MDLIAQLEAEHVASLGKDIPDFKAGDTVRVGYKVTEGSRTRVQNYEGVCIARKNGSGVAGSFTVRKISFGEGVERSNDGNSETLARGDDDDENDEDEDEVEDPVSDFLTVSSTTFT